MPASLFFLRSLSQERVATRARFKILHHHAIPNQGQTGIGGKTPPASNIVCNQYGTAKGKRVYGSAPQRASLSSTPTSASNGEPASPPFVVIDGNNAGVLLQDAGGGWSVRGALLAIQVGARPVRCRARANHRRGLRCCWSCSVACHQRGQVLPVGLFSERGVTEYRTNGRD